jgi:hypothetical protein
MRQLPGLGTLQSRRKNSLRQMDLEPPFQLDRRYHGRHPYIEVFLPCFAKTVRVIQSNTDWKSKNSRSTVIMFVLLYPFA